ncbi:Pxylp1 [Columba guinea]|nr:Pxylp1 [Columba guinea]
MLFRNRFLFLLALAALLAFLSLSLQFLHLIPVNPIREDGLNPKSRKRIMPDLLTEPPVIDPVYEARVYCNIPTIAERSMEAVFSSAFGSFHILVYLSRKPSHPQLEAFIKQMSKGSAAQMDGPLSSLPRYPSHSLCEMGELTQTGVVQHLRNGQLLREIYINKHKLLLSDWTAKQLYLETTGKSRTLQSALALLYTFLPDFDWKKINMRHQWSTIFCSGSCDCPMRNHYLEEEQRRQYSLRVKNNDLEKIYVDMAKIVGIPTRQLRASNPIDSLLCYFCHNVSFPCTKTGCISMEHFKVIKRHQLEDERERQEKKLYFFYALLATHPLLNQTVHRLQRIAEGKKEEVFVLYSAHDVTLSPVLSALGITEARFPRFAARLVFELWQDGKRPKEHFIRILYNGADVTFQTSFCKDYYKRSSKPMCPLEKFVNFVKRDMFLVFNSTSYYDACRRRPL